MLEDPLLIVRTQREEGALGLEDPGTSVSSVQCSVFSQDLVLAAPQRSEGGSSSTLPI
jgi:hypothetical protein